MSNLLSLSSAQLKRAADLKDKIETLNKELSSILGSSPATTTKPSTSHPQKRKMSAGAKAKIAAAQKARWAKVNAKKSSPKAEVKPAKKKSTMSAEGRAKIAAAARARWAKAKAAGKKSL